MDQYYASNIYEHIICRNKLYVLMATYMGAMHISASHTPGYVECGFCMATNGVVSGPSDKGGGGDVKSIRSPQPRLVVGM